MLRAASYEALENENKKINQALIGAAISFGVNIEICDEPGYAPLHHDALLSEAAREAFNRIEPLTTIPNRRLGDSGTSISGGTMDIGDLSMVMPVIHPYMGGSEGKGHGNDYYIVDPVTACITNAEWQVAILTVLLENGAQKAEEVAANYKAPFTSKEEFLKHQDNIRKCCECLEYRDNGEIKILI
jgi:metal-dependent amidase/aminoacylase/carboxypeptidase family protein